MYISIKVECIYMYWTDFINFLHQFLVSAHWFVLCFILVAFYFFLILCVRLSCLWSALRVH